MHDIDLIEANEAFSDQALHVNTALGLDSNKVNVNGGRLHLVIQLELQVVVF